MEFRNENILLDVAVKDKLALFEYIADYAVTHKLVADGEALVEAFLKREREVSTGLQDSFAIPHAKAAFINEPIVLFLKLSQPIEWETFDDKPVANVFALLVPSEFEGMVHLQMISQIATSLMEESFTDIIKHTDDVTLLTKTISSAMNGEY